MKGNSRYSPFTIHRQSIQSSPNVNLNSSQHSEVCLKAGQGGMFLSEPGLSEKALRSSPPQIGLRNRAGAFWVGPAFHPLVLWSAGLTVSIYAPWKVAGRLNRPGSNRAGMIMHNDQGQRCLRYAAIAPHGRTASN